MIKCPWGKEGSGPSKWVNGLLDLDTWETDRTFLGAVQGVIFIIGRRGWGAVGIPKRPQEEVFHREPLPGTVHGLAVPQNTKHGITFWLKIPVRWTSERTEDRDSSRHLYTNVHHSIHKKQNMENPGIHPMNRVWYRQDYSTRRINKVDTLF